ncbi:MAG: HD domain-containing phosphohydrolase [Planctomycetota bacterium]
MDTQFNTHSTENIPAVPIVPRLPQTLLPVESARNAAIERIKQSKIMIIDDEQLVIKVVRRFLQSEGYENFVTLTQSTGAVERMEQEQPDVVLLDVMMPEISGLDILRERRRIPSLQLTPFIILSGSQDLEFKQEALEHGATDFLGKPVEKIELTLRVKNSLLLKQQYKDLEVHAHELEQEVQDRTRQLERSREQILQCLARAAEYRDNETGRHVVRVGKYARVVAERLGLPKEFCGQIELAAQLHDLGKIGIPDSILLNPGKLSEEEFAVMKRHCEIGREILDPFAADEMEELRQNKSDPARLPSNIRSPLLVLAAKIAQTHHEKWDGTGYPLGLKGEQIPIEGRITSVSDVYDALCSVRPYKEGFSVEQALRIMLAERGTRFDPKVLDAFVDQIPRIEKIRKAYSDN